MITSFVVAFLLQTAPAAASAAQSAPLAPPPPPNVVIAANPKRQPIVVNLPNPPLVCGYEVAPGAKDHAYVCRTQAEIDANKRKGFSFTLARPIPPVKRTAS